MKNRKRIAAVVTTAALVCAMSMTALANGNGTVDTEGGTKEITVTGNYVEGTEGVTVYQVDLTWNSMGFTYTDASEGTWDPDAHQYIDSTEAAWSWEDDANQITVTNHSNTAVDAEFTYDANPGYEAITAGFYDATKAGSVLSDSKLTLESAEPEAGSQAGTAKSGNAYLQITGGSLENGGSSQEIGKITVTIRNAVQP